MKKILLIFLSVFAFVSVHANITWSLSKDGVLTISGTDMPNYNPYEAPWYSLRLSIKKVEIKDGVTNIGENAFLGCSVLTSITIPNSVTIISDYVFYGCSDLTSITIPNSVTIIGSFAFGGIPSLTSITVEKGNVKYDSRNNCNAIIETATNTLKKGCKNTIIPNSVTSIGNSAFGGCSGLTSIDIPHSVISIGEEAFEDCSSLTSIAIPNSVTSIGSGAFWNCSGLTSITIPNSVTNIGEHIFYSCNNLMSISVEEGNVKYDSRNNCGAIIETTTNTLIAGCKNTIIPNSVINIGDYAFSGNSVLTSITIPNSVTSIGKAAFEGCSGLISITIPYSILGIGDSAFERCSGLTSITLPNSMTSIGNWVFRDCSGLTSVIIPNSVTSIGNSAFSGCSGLTSITIPSSVNSIGFWAFEACYSLTSVTNLSTSPQSITSATFTNKVTLHVLPGYKSEYENAAWWRYFKIVEDAVDPFASIELTDGKTYNEETSQDNKEITYTRTFNNTSWQSLYIPFSMTFDDWKDDFEVAYINGIRQMDTDDDGAIDETIMDVVKIKSGSLIPNTPYLIKAKTTGNKTITVNDATLYKSESNSVDCSTTIAKYTFTGTYSTIPAATLLANNYYAMGGGSLIMTDGASDLKPFRWYLNVESRSPMYNVSNGAKAITINVVGEEEATGISQMSSDRENSSTIYDLNGRRMSQKNMKSGLYIKNGKKIIIK